MRTLGHQELQVPFLPWLSLLIELSLKNEDPFVIVKWGHVEHFNIE